MAHAVARCTFPASRSVQQITGITGAPGAGKSTLTDRLIARWRTDGDTVGVLAVDPSSPFSGGALLGDRVRMQRHATDPGVFIRSMATRGHLGGLTLAVPEALRVLVAAGWGRVLVETVGVGQAEVEIADNADTTVVVVNPGWGDAIQANKAGLLEVADVLVINKADRPGAAETARDLATMLDTYREARPWRPPVVATVATTGEGIEELWESLRRHMDFLRSSGELGARREARLRRELNEVVTRRIEAAVRGGAQAPRWALIEAEVGAQRLDPYEAATILLGELGLDPDATQRPAAG